ncbi:Uncharacterised protein [BD1-7 clade bacterium]|uniref:VWFA domain-containing protein n=1 Tax=BD1-7 clade bacterium TaxID=2029982 RepID=A0A5S9NV06_9GAMM|nr:Uncharacterised protein [BD1-7 clade bacterium]CAA0094556.1 Uncharacterised protein [BD1-7 clade bacterium]
MIEFTLPWIFALLPLPLLVWWLIPARKQTSAALYMPHVQSDNLRQHDISPGRFSWLRFLPLLAIWILLLAAAANPMRIGEAIELPANGRDLMLAVDISGSMEQRDMTINGRRVNRLVATKDVLTRFLSQRQGDRVGLILYGSQAFVQAPLTFDLKTVHRLLMESQIGFAGTGTAIGDAIGLGIKRLADNPAESRVLILLTDGENTSGTMLPVEAAKFATKEHVKIYTIGLGHPRSRYPIDERTLKEVADITGGEFFRARSQQELASIYAAIDKLEAVEQEAEIFRPKQTLFYWPLGGAMALALLFGLINVGSRRLHTRSTSV